MLKIMTSLAFGLAVITSSAIYAEDVVSEHKKALGAKEAVEKIKSIRRTGEIEFKGQFSAEGTIEEYAVLGKKSAQKIKGGEFESTQIWNGEKGWAMNTYVPTAELTPEQVDQMKGVASLNPFLGMVADVPADKLVAGEDAEFGGVACKTYKPEEKLTIYIGKEDHLFHGMSVNGKDPGGGDLKIKIVNSDFKEYGGVKFPDSIVTNINDDQIIATVKFSKTEINPTLGDELFAKP